MTDARERRRQHHQAEAKGHPLDTVKKYKVPIIIVVVWGLIISYNVAVGMGVIGEVNTGDECPGHWHAGYAVHIDGDQLDFTHPSFSDASASPGAGAHIHGNDGLMHMHPSSPRCIPVGDILEKLGVEVSNGEIVVAATHSQAGTYADDETMEVQVHHKPWEGSWKQVSNINKFMDKQMGNGDQILITYVAAGDAASVDAQKEQVRSLVGDASYEPASTKPTVGDRFVPMMAVTLFAAVALFVWNSMRQKN